MRKCVTTALGAACVVLVSAGSAAAAGGGYGGSSGANGESTPAGFSSISAVYAIIATKGGAVGTKDIHLRVPKHATEQNVVIAIYKGSASTATRYRSAYLSRDRVIATFGVGIFAGPTPTRSTKPITVTYDNSELKPGDHLAVYNASTHKFGAVTATFSHGKVSFQIEAGQSVAIFS